MHISDPVVMGSHVSINSVSEETVRLFVTQRGYGVQERVSINSVSEETVRLAISKLTLSMSGTTTSFPLIPFPKKR